MGLLALAPLRRAGSDLMYQADDIDSLLKQVEAILSAARALT